MGVLLIRKLFQGVRDGVAARAAKQRAPIKFTPLDDEIVQGAFLIRLAQHRFFDRVLRDEAVDMHVTNLPDTVCPVAQASTLKLYLEEQG